MKRANELEFALGLRPEGITLQRWLYNELRDAVLSGRIAPGRRLPSSRDFARQQDISRGTVLAVYEQLIAEGYLIGTTGSGTTVSPNLPANLPAAVPPRALASTRLSQQGKRLACSPFVMGEQRMPLQPFRPNQPDVSAFPIATWRQLANRYGRTRWADELHYGDAAGYAPLRQAIAEHLHYSQRIACEASQVVIFSSAQQALDLSARLLLDPGDAVLMEDPGYPGAARIFGLNGARIIGVPVDMQGLRTDPPLPSTPDVRMAYVTAAHQAPLGGSLPLERRLALLSWAEANNTMIIEDDYDGEFRFDGQPLPALKSLDGSEHVIYMGSFSKLLFPALRLAYMVVPAWMADAYRSAISLTCRHAPVYQQAVLADFIAGGHFARHLHRMRLLYAERARRFQHECKTRFAGLLKPIPVSTGLDATVLLPAHVNDADVAAALNRNGIETRAVSFYCMQQKAPPGLVMGFSSFDETAMRNGMDDMEKVFGQLAL
ncbi:MocR-like pyridoxine biosynthesis transcription factor PdxR [Pseudoduganella sp. RAF53_2]|uniref:MocR-like pyridoxine biosynthesis transcription factor PdxR n=1 Tax=unclassified Pseudoduganella TaxID=2637179 RepID=UPI003F95A3EB